MERALELSARQHSQDRTMRPRAQFYNSDSTGCIGNSNGCGDNGGCEVHHQHVYVPPPHGQQVISSHGQLRRNQIEIEFVEPCVSRERRSQQNFWLLAFSNFLNQVVSRPKERYRVEEEADEDDDEEDDQREDDDGGSERAEDYELDHEQEEEEGEEDEVFSKK